MQVTKIIYYLLHWWFSNYALWNPIKIKLKEEQWIRPWRDIAFIFPPNQCNLYQRNSLLFALYIILLINIICEKNDSCISLVFKCILNKSIVTRVDFLSDSSCIGKNKLCEGLQYTILQFSVWNKNGFLNIFIYFLFKKRNNIYLNT